MGLVDIVQYEVQVLQDGHWSVRSRFTRSERDHAVTEARRIDLNESHASRVVRDVFDPNNGRSQELTIFMSDRAKAYKPSAPATAPGKAAPRPSQKAAPTRASFRRAPLVFRATMALGVGFVTALLITAIATWALTPAQDSFASVIARSPAPGSAMTLFVAVVLFSLFTLLRGPLSITRLTRTLGAHIGLHLNGHGAVEKTTRIIEPAAVRVRREPVLRPVAPCGDHNTRVLSMSQVVLARFFAEAAPVNAARAMEDALGLRGLALYLAGAASELAAHLEMPSPVDLLTQITPSLLRDAAQEAFGDLRAVDPADAVLVAAGRTGMRKYVSTAHDHPSMADALAAWRKSARAESPAASEARVS